jgi:hypothetical protein
MAKTKKIEAAKAKLHECLSAIERSQAQKYPPHEDACLISAIKAARDAEMLLVRVRNYS